MLPSHIVVDCQKWRCPNHHSTPAKISSLTGVGMNVGQMKHSYLCLTAFIMTEPWLKKPKMLPSHIVVECQIMKLHQQPQNIYKNAFQDRHRNEFGSNKKFWSMFNNFYYDWSLAEGAKNAAQPHCCWLPKRKLPQPPQHYCKYAFPDLCRNEFGSKKILIHV